MKRLIMIGGLVAALALGAVAVAAAQEGTSTPSPTPAATDDDADDGDKETLREEFLDRLAENLGVSRETLDQAIDETQLELIDQALADGKIDEEEAAELRERVQNGEPLFPFFGRPGHHPRIFHFAVSFVELAADVLGIDESDLREQLHDGQSLADVAESQGMDLEQFKSDLLAAVKSKLDEKVADGDLTQERADEIYARVSENIDEIVEKTHDGPPFFRGRPGPFFRDGNFPGFPPFEDIESGFESFREESGGSSSGA